MHPFSITLPFKGSRSSWYIDRNIEQNATELWLESGTEDNVASSQLKLRFFFAIEIQCGRLVLYRMCSHVIKWWTQRNQMQMVMGRIKWLHGSFATKRYLFIVIGSGPRVQTEELNVSAITFDFCCQFRLCVISWRNRGTNSKPITESQLSFPWHTHL